jgi:hypothetical protein
VKPVILHHGRKHSSNSLCEANTAGASSTGVKPSRWRLSIPICLPDESTIERAAASGGRWSWRSCNVFFCSSSPPRASAAAEPRAAPRSWPEAGARTDRFVMLRTPRHWLGRSVNCSRSGSPDVPDQLRPATARIASIAGFKKSTHIQLAQPGFPPSNSDRRQLPPS